MQRQVGKSSHARMKKLPSLSPLPYRCMPKYVCMDVCIYIFFCMCVCMYFLLLQYIRVYCSFWHAFNYRSHVFFSFEL